MSSTTTIALSGLPPQRTSTHSAPTTPGTNVSTGCSGSQQTVAQSGGTPPPQAPASAPHTPPSTQATALSATGTASTQDSQPTWLRKAKPVLKVCGSAIKFTIAVVGVSWAIYIGAAGLDLQKWSAKNDSLQSCLALESRSKYCNATIEAGVGPPPNWKRDAGTLEPTTLIASWYLATSSSPAAAAAAVMVTVAAILVATIHSWPRMEPFHPVISSVRLVATDLVGGITGAYGLRWIEWFVADQYLWLAIMDDLNSILVLAVQGTPQHSPRGTIPITNEDEDDGAFIGDGCPIGVFYDSEPDSVDDDGEDDHQLDDECSNPENLEDTESDADHDNTSLHSGDHQKYLAITMSDLLYMEDRIREHLHSYSRDTTARLVATSLNVRKEKELLMKEAQTETLVRILVCSSGLSNRHQDMPDHLWLGTHWLAGRHPQWVPDQEKLQAALARLPWSSHRCIVQDVLAELQLRIPWGKAILHEEYPSKDPVCTLLLDLYNSSEFLPLSAAPPVVMWQSEFRPLSAASPVGKRKPDVKMLEKSLDHRADSVPNQRADCPSYDRAPSSKRISIFRKFARSGRRKVL